MSDINEGGMTEGQRRQIKANLEEQFKQGHFIAGLSSLDACMELFLVMDKERTKYPFTQAQREAISGSLTEVARCARELADRFQKGDGK